MSAPTTISTRGSGKLTTAFALIEVLVVAAIIALLTSILLPSLQAARARSRRLLCANNLRSIWTGVLSYTIEHRDRLPFMEDVNLTLPEADPFDRNCPTTVGRVLFRHVIPRSWRCPTAVSGFPLSAGAGNWKMTYEFSTAGKVGQGIPYDRNREAFSGSPLDPAISNYVHFDGRPLRILDGRRYVQTPSASSNRNRKGYWNVRRAIISDRMAGQPALGKPKYPHWSPLAARTDLGQARLQFENNTNGPGYRPGYHELHADGDRVDIYFTRYWQQHWPGY